MRSQETESRSLSMVRRAWVIESFVTIILLQIEGKFLPCMTRKQMITLFFDLIFIFYHFFGTTVKSVS